MDDLPDMSDVLREWERPHRVKTVSEETLDFELVGAVTGRDMLAVVQVAQKKSLVTEQIDYSLRYLMIHTRDAALANGELIVWKGEDHKVIDVGPWDDYGYREAVAEQTSRPLVQESAP